MHFSWRLSFRSFKLTNRLDIVTTTEAPMPKKEKNFSAGDVIFKQGEPCRYVYTILEGRVEMFYEVAGKTRVLATKTEDDVLGANCVLDGTYDTSARAANSVVLRVVDADEYIAGLQRSGELSPSAEREGGEDGFAADDDAGFDFDFGDGFGGGEDPESETEGRGSPATRYSSRGKGRSTALTRMGEGAENRDAANKKQAVVKVERPRPAAVAKMQKPKILPADIKRSPIREWLLESSEEPPSFGPVVLLASVAGDEDGSCRDMIYAVLRQVPNLQIKAVDSAIVDSNPQRAAMQMRSWMAQHSADVGLYSSLDAAGRLLEFHAVKTVLPHETSSSALRAGARFYLPVEMGSDYQALLKIFTVAAIVPTRLEHEQLMRLFLPSAVREAASFAMKPAVGMNEEEQAVNLACFGGALTVAGLFKPAADDRDLATQAYLSALKLMPSSAPEYVFVNRQIGLLHQISGEKQDDMKTLREAEKTFIAAAEAVSPSVQPETWGDLKIRIGNVRRKIASHSGEGGDFASAMAAYREALSRLKASVHTEKWADAMNGLARTMQEFGAYSPKTTLLEKAVELYERELAVVDKERFPMIWAAAGNNLASALFMLFDKTGDAALLRRAVDVFSEALAVYDDLGAANMAAVATNNLRRARQTLTEVERELEKKKNWLSDILDDRKDDDGEAVSTDDEPLVFERIAVFEELDDEEE